jgi:hypothetical protein
LDAGLGPEERLNVMGLVRISLVQAEYRILDFRS